jgi:hypothetical protein
MHSIAWDLFGQPGSAPDSETPRRSTTRDHGGIGALSHVRISHSPMAGVRGL